MVTLRLFKAELELHRTLSSLLAKHAPLKQPLVHVTANSVLHIIHRVPKGVANDYVKCLGL